MGRAPFAGALSLTLGLVSGAGLIGWGRILTGRWLISLRLVVLKMALVAVSVLRLYLCFAAIGDPARFDQVAIFAFLVTALDRLVGMSLLIAFATGLSALDSALTRKRMTCCE